VHSVEFPVIPVDRFVPTAPGERKRDRALDPAGRRIALVVGRGRRERELAVRSVARAWAARYPSGVVLAAPAAVTWPFRHPLAPAFPDRPAIIWAPDVHEAFVNHQASGTRLVTTQGAYLMETWRTALEGRDDLLLLATADHEALERHAPEALAGRGAFRRALVHVLSEDDGSRQPAAGSGEQALEDTSDDGGRRVDDGAVEGLLARAFREADPDERLALCVQALDRGRTAPALVAAASASMEVNDLEAAARDSSEALTQAPDWAAAHFERGKLWLRRDDMERASASFREAAERLPGFASAWANLGATLGELDRPEAALAAFEHALTCDPGNHQVLNNIGVVRRELGRLVEAEDACRQVIAVVPDLAFGYYNLGHTLFLQGRYHAALGAYAEGQRRDPERNPVQASRLAMCRLATGDPSGAVKELQQATTRLPRDYRRQLLADTGAIAMALLTHKPDLTGWKQVNDWVQGELARIG
jgi:tetratricopeptide (TPR) repeat protein